MTEELRQCVGCGALVVMTGHPTTSGGTAWIADPHPAPCGLPCWTCAIGSVAELHHAETCPRCKVPIDLQVTCACGNAGRYITARGRITCAVCAIDQLAVRANDIPTLLETVETILDELEGSPILRDERERLRAILGR